MRPAVCGRSPTPTPPPTPTGTGILTRRDREARLKGALPAFQTSDLMTFETWSKSMKPLRVIMPMAVLSLASPAAAQQQPDSLPEGVTLEMVSEGKILYNGLGICAVCHGPDAKGATAPDLTDDEWLHSDGSFEAIVKQILTGVPLEESTSGMPMLPKGGSGLTEQQVQAVAAYVWSLRELGS